MKFTANELSQSMELGSTSTWTCSFGSAPNFDLSPMNKIKGQLAPVRDIEYRYWEVVTKELTVGPEISLKIPVRAKMVPSTIDCTIYDDDDHTMHNLLKAWVESAVKERAAGKGDYGVINIFKNNKAGKLLFKDSFYVFPTGTFIWKGDQDFQASTFPLQLIVKGRQ